MEHASASTTQDEDSKSPVAGPGPTGHKARQRSRRKNIEAEEDPSKRRCVSTACVQCRKRKSKCDGNLPACAACSQVYGTECIYDPNSDHRRKGVYKNDYDNLKTRNTTLHTLIQAILNYPEDEAFALVREIRSCESLDTVAEKLAAKDDGLVSEGEDDVSIIPAQNGTSQEPTFERQLYGKMGDLRLDDGTVRYIGGTSNLIHVDHEDDGSETDEYLQQENAVTSWTTVTDDANLVMHLLNMYFTWHYTYFTTMSKTLFYRDFLLGKPPPTTRRKTHYCTPLLVNAILALGCHFTSHRGARESPDDSATAGDHFFKEAKRLIMENDEHERPRLANIQALAIMSVREAGCAREAKGWVYSGMSFRMACDMGLNLNTGQLTTNKNVNGDEAEEDVRRITFWGCYLFDKCWSNYLGRMPQLPSSIVTVPKFEVFLDEDSVQWSPYTDSGFTQAHSQPSRTRAVALQISKLCEISNDLLKYFYNPIDMEKNRGKSAELKMLSDIHTRLEAWRRSLPKEMEPREGGLSSILVMHMFFQLLFIHLFRPFLRYTEATSPLPPTGSPRKRCTQAAAMVSKLMRLYKRSHGLRQICNIAVYIAHSACTIHLLNLPDRNAKRDIVHGVKHLEEIAEGWLCARRSLGMLSLLAAKWKVALPEEATTVLARTDKKFGTYQEAQSPPRRSAERVMNPSQFTPQQRASVPNSVNPTGSVAIQSTAAAHLPVTATLQPQGNAYSMPPHDPSALRAQQQQPPVPTTPQSKLLNQQSDGPMHVPSPSEMFGGVEQLIRDSQDWVYRDQTQIASGFDNWTSMNMDPATWGAAAPIGDDGIVGSTSPVMQMPNMQTNAYPTAYDGIDGYPVLDWLNGQTMQNNMTMYNEDEWYQ